MSFIRFEQRCESVAPDLLRPDPCPTNKVVHRYIILYGDEINGKKKFSTFLSKEKIMRERERGRERKRRGDSGLHVTGLEMAKDQRTRWLAYEMANDGDAAQG